MTEHIIVDSHCHLDFPDFEGEIPDLVARANDAGVKRMVTICTKLKNEPSVRKIAEEHEAVYYAAGTHPMSAASEPLASVDQLIKISQHPKMVGIGETGLDYHYTAESAEIQKTSLKIHIEAARETDLPLIIHSRAADEDTSSGSGGDLVRARAVRTRCRAILIGPALVAVMALGGRLTERLAVAFPWSNG